MALRLSPRHRFAGLARRNDVPKMRSRKPRHHYYSSNNQPDGHVARNKSRVENFTVNFRTQRVRSDFAPAQKLFNSRVVQICVHGRTCGYACIRSRDSRRLGNNTRKEEGEESELMKNDSSCRSLSQVFHFTTGNYRLFR